MTIYLASDHAGFNLKKSIADFLSSQNYNLVDCGDYKSNPNDDYPKFIAKACEKVSLDPSARAIVFGKSGAGEEIVANKFPNVRAVLGFSDENVRLSRQDNDANVLSLGSEFITQQKALTLVKIFLETPFSNKPRHKRRIEEIKKIENE